MFIVRGVDKERVFYLCSRAMNDLELTLLTWIASNVKLKKNKARLGIIQSI